MAAIPKEKVMSLLRPSNTIISGGRELARILILQH
jgi:hypothetical protein